MSRLSEIQNEYARENGAENWFELISNIDDAFDPRLDNYYHDTYMQYLKECCQACLEKAYQESLIDGSEFSRCGCSINEKSITDNNNIVLL